MESTAPIKVLVVDDAVVARRALAEAIEEDFDFKLVGVAGSGEIALKKIALSHPDVVVLDLAMPDMNGIETLRRLLREYPRVKVVMLSGQETPDSDSALEALNLGALDFIAKPKPFSYDPGDEWRAELRSRIKAAHGRSLIQPAPSCPVPPAATQPVVERAAPARPARVDIVAIGVSTGGPEALHQIVAALPGDFPVPIVIVQHMPATFTRLLARRLAVFAQLQIMEGADGAQVLPGQIWIAPGERHMVVARSAGEVRIQTHGGPPENSCRPSADVLLRSVADVYGAHALGVVLTGMGQDGMRGAEAIVKAGGLVLAQDKETSVVWGMAGSVVQAGLAHRVLPIDQIAPHLVQITAYGRMKEKVERCP